MERERLEAGICSFERKARHSLGNKHSNEGERVDWEDQAVELLALNRLFCIRGLLGLYSSPWKRPRESILLERTSFLKKQDCLLNVAFRVQPGFF